MDNETKRRGARKDHCKHMDVMSQCKGRVCAWHSGHFHGYLCCLRAHGDGPGRPHPLLPPTPTEKFFSISM
eukprot:4303476-Amphidinium_carterae.1